MKDKPKCISKECLAKIDKLLASCAETGEFLNKCKDCGLDVDREIRANDEQAEVAGNLKRKFFPGAK